MADFDPANIRELTDDEELDVFRIVPTDDTTQQSYADAFLSRHERGFPPRRPEQIHPILHVGISAFLTLEGAVSTANQWPRIGRYVARVRLTAGQGFTLALWGAQGHLTVWGEAIKLRATVVDITSIDGQTDIPIEQDE